MTKKVSDPHKLTPLMKQYLEIKAQYPDTLLLYRMGDFYETFNDDAKIMAKILGIALTARGGEDATPLAGFPYHALDAHLPKLIKAGLKIARCEQVEDPKLAKGIVRREVIEIVSPGSTFSDKILDFRQNNFVMSAFFQNNLYGFAIADVSTGECFLCEIPESDLSYFLNDYPCKEIIISHAQREFLTAHLQNDLNVVFSVAENWFFDYDFAYDLLIKQFQTHSLKGFGCHDMRFAISACGALFNFLRLHYKSELQQFKQIESLHYSEIMALDIATKRNLELYHTMNDFQQSQSLLSVLDKTKTAMGARLLRRWISQALIHKDKIDERLDLVESMIQSDKLSDFTEKLNEIADIERIIGRIASGRCNARDFLQLKHSLQQLTPIKSLCAELASPAWDLLADQIQDLDSVIDLIERGIHPEAGYTITEGNIIRDDYHVELDELRHLCSHSKEIILDIQERERKRTGIGSLKINFTKVFGYYIEITHTHRDKVPLDYIRKQTLVNAERYITDELKQCEEKILGAEEKIHELEYELFQELRDIICRKISEIQKSAKTVAEIDYFCSMAANAISNNYFKPKMTDDGIIAYKRGRHPVIEKNLAADQSFIHNDCYLSHDKQQIMIITGPNMAGKSTFLRQTGLIVLMAQIGSFVPAENCSISVCDRIFTRVGASDNIAGGESTFLVEMNEAANILNHASPHSLILFDELGRGTSTFDGLAIAWSVIEYLHNNKLRAAKTLFATHYHELTEMAMIYPRIKNYNIAVEEHDEKIIFLRKIVEGGTDHSYGIQVAQMAGLPAQVIERAKEILINLEENEINPLTKRPNISQRRRGRNIDQNQLQLFNNDSKQINRDLEKRIEQISINEITPLEALIELQALKKIVGKSLE